MPGRLTAHGTILYRQGLLILTEDASIERSIPATTEGQGRPGTGGLCPLRRRVQSNYSPFLLPFLLPLRSGETKC